MNGTDTPREDLAADASDAPDRAGPRAWLWLGLPLLVITIFVVLSYERLPERMASHFDASGRPDGWMSKGGFVALFLGITAGIALLFGGLIALIPRIPDHLVNMPNRDYWLAAPRRAETHRAIAQNLVLHALLAMAIMAYVLFGTIEFNLSKSEKSSVSIWIPLVVYLIVTGLLVAQLYRRFRLPEDASQHDAELS